MEDALKIGSAFLAGIVAIAIVSVIVSKKSQAPQAVQALSSAVGNVVSAAVNPVSQAYGFGNGSQTSQSPASYQPGWNMSSFTGLLAPFNPGGSH